MAQKQQQNNTFFGGAAILAVGIVMVKIISMFYKLPLVNILGSSGYADFTAAFNVFNILLMISTAGVPVAVSKMISEATVSGRLNQTHKIFEVTFLFFLTVGLICTLIMYFGADFFAHVMNDTKAAACMRVLAPSVMLVSGLAAFRGYAQGHRNMTPSSVSQIIEALLKLIVGLTLAWYMIRVLRLPDHLGAARAIVGVTISEMAALLYMTGNFVRTRLREPSDPADRPDGALRILKNCLSLAIPITLTASSTSVITAVDNALVMGRLQHAGLHLEEQAARALMGNYTGVQTVYQIPAALMVAITASVIPAVTICFTQRNRTGAATIVASSLKMAALIAIPSGVGMTVLGQPIVQLLFPRLDPVIAGQILSILGLANIFVCLMLVANSVLQAHGILILPICTMLIGGVVMVLFDYFMVGTVRFNIFGSPIGTCICYAITCGLDLFIVSRVVPGCPNYVRIFAKPLAASVVMGFAAWAVFGLARRVVGPRLGVLVAVVMAVAVYGALIVLLRVLNKDDLSLMPKGQAIGRLLRIQ